MLIFPYILVDIVYSSLRLGLASFAILFKVKQLSEADVIYWSTDSDISAFLLLFILSFHFMRLTYLSWFQVEVFTNWLL